MSRYRVLTRLKSSSSRLVARLCSQVDLREPKAVFWNPTDPLSFIPRGLLCARFFDLIVLVGCGIYDCYGDDMLLRDSSALPTPAASFEVRISRSTSLACSSVVIFLFDFKGPCLFVFLLGASIPNYSNMGLMLASSTGSIDFLSAEIKNGSGIRTVSVYHILTQNGLFLRLIDGSETNAQTEQVAECWI